jgi:hypothetical protein
MCGDILDEFDRPGRTAAVSFHKCAEVRPGLLNDSCILNNDLGELILPVIGRQTAMTARKLV